MQVLVMNESELIDALKIFIGFVIACIGWVTVHFFTSRRDVANLQRAIRNSALAEAYRALVRAGIDGVMVYKDRDGEIVNGAKAVEDAIALIHLYGSIEQSILASKYAQAVSSNNSADVTIIVNVLRKDIRSALGLCEIEKTPIFLKVAVIGEKTHDLSKDAQQYN